MELSRKSCRLCLSESEFNVSLFGNYCRRTCIIDKILVCLKLVIEETDTMDTICYKCAENVERYYDFIMFVKKCQTKMAEPRQEASVSRRHVTSYVREEVFDDDYTFSFLTEPPEKKKPKPSSPFFSYFSPPKVVNKATEPMWKTPFVEKREKREDKFPSQRKESRKSGQNSRDIFESQSQEAEDPKSLNWSLTPIENILKQVREKCFGRSEY